MQLSIFSLAEHRASPFLSQDCVRAWLTHEETLPSRILGSLIDTVPNGSFGKTSPVSCQRTAGEPLAPSSGGWQNSGMGSPTEFLTLSTCEWTGLDGLFLNDAGVCSLSEILETGDVPRRYYLSQKACLGILRRAAKRGKELPPMLHRALSAVAGELNAPAKLGAKTQ